MQWPGGWVRHRYHNQAHPSCQSSQQLQIRSSLNAIHGRSSCLSRSIAPSPHKTRCLPRPPSQGNLSILRLRMPENCRSQRAELWPRCPEWCGAQAGADRSSRKPSLFAVEPIHAFYMFLAANLVSALFNPIQDCDETFNFLEPTHYLAHGYGLQTWEWSPAYGIRDWLYVLPHAVVAGVRRLLPQATKVRLFCLKNRVCDQC